MPILMMLPIHTHVYGISCLQSAIVMPSLTLSMALSLSRRSSKASRDTVTEPHGLWWILLSDPVSSYRAALSTEWSRLHSRHHFPEITMIWLAVHPHKRQEGALRRSSSHIAGLMARILWPICACARQQRVCQPAL